MNSSLNNLILEFITFCKHTKKFFIFICFLDSYIKDKIIFIKVMSFKGSDHEVTIHINHFQHIT
jgi:hypothetical protein